MFDIIIIMCNNLHGLIVINYLSHIVIYSLQNLLFGFRQPRWLSGLTRSCVHSQWLLVDQCVLSNWDRILVRAVKGLISRAGMVSIWTLLWQRDVKLQQTNILFGFRCHAVIIRNIYWLWRWKYISISLICNYKWVIMLNQCYFCL